MSLSITIYTSHWSRFSGEPWLIHTCIILSNLDEHKTRLSSEETSQRQGVCSSHGISDLAAAATAAKSPHLCPTLCDPIDSSPPDSPSLGFSRQQHWSGLPFPSPTHESEKWKWSHSVVSDPPRPHGPQPTRLLHPWDFPGKSTGVGCHCLLQVTLSLC